MKKEYVSLPVGVKAVYKVKITEAIRKDTVFVPYHFGHDQSINLLTIAALDPISRMPEFKACAAQIEKIEHKEGAINEKEAIY